MKQTFQFTVTIRFGRTGFHRVTVENALKTVLKRGLRSYARVTRHGYIPDKIARVVVYIDAIDIDIDNT